MGWLAAPVRPNLGEGGEEEGNQPRPYVSPASSCPSHKPLLRSLNPPCMHLTRPSPSSYPPPPLYQELPVLQPGCHHRQVLLHPPPRTRMKGSLFFSQGATTVRSCCTPSVCTSFTASGSSGMSRSSSPSTDRGVHPVPNVKQTALAGYQEGGGEKEGGGGH